MSRALPTAIATGFFGLALLGAGAPALLAQSSSADSAQDPGSSVVGPRLIATATPETVAPRGAEILASFRISETVQAGSAHDLWGIDSGADVGLGFALGLNSRQDLELFRSSADETFELATKVALWQQAAGAPLSVATRLGLDYVDEPGATARARPFVEIPISYRISQLTLFVTPAWVRDTPQLRNVFNVPVGFAWQFASRWGINAEYVAKNHDLASSQAAWAAALALRAGHDLFKLTFENSRATTVDEILGGDFAGGFKAGDVRLGLNFTHDLQF